MGATLKITFDKKEVEKELGKIEGGLKDLREPFEKMGKELTEDFYGKKVFDTQGGAIGEKWRPLTAATLLARERGRGHYRNKPIATGKILIWTGKLKGGFKKTVEKLRLTIENSVEYFKYNQPKRKMLDINKEVLEIVLKNIEDYLKKLTK